MMVRDNAGRPYRIDLIAALASALVSWSPRRRPLSPRAHTRIRYKAVYMPARRLPAGS